MGESEVKTEFVEAMEESQGGGAEKIDMSLDEIIKLNRKEQKASVAASRARNKRVTNRNNVLKKLSQTPQPRRGLRRGALQFQGPSRTRGLRRSRASGRGGTGFSPLNRPAPDTETDEQLSQSTSPLRGSFRGRGRGRGRGGFSRGALSARGQRASQRGGRPFVLDRGFLATRGTAKLERYQKIRSQSQTPAESPGTMLTVSLPNAKLAQATQVRPRRGAPAFRGRSSDAEASQEPRGVPLRFNYKATSNQTTVSLNDRFTSLRFRGWGGRGGDRGGRGRGGRGRGRGRGRGEIRGGRGGGVRGLGRARGGGGRVRGRGARAASTGPRGLFSRTVVLQ